MTARSFGPALRKRLWVGVLLVLALVFLLSAMRYLRPDEKADLPKLGLMTTLPLQWSEGGVEAAVAADAAPHPAFARLSSAYEIVPIDDFETIDRLGMLLLAQPRAISPAELVRLDSWLRRGGRILVLADPALQWGSIYPIGDKRRPLFTSLLSPLFAHWGVELVLPIDDASPVTVQQIDGFLIRTQTPGEWRPKGDEPGSCTIGRDRIYAACTVGKGRAILVADADLLDPPYWEGQGARFLTRSDEYGNMHWIEALLAALHSWEIMGK